MSTFEQLPSTARVWIYQSPEPLGDEAAEKVRRSVAEFTHQWTSHNVALQASGGLVHNRFIILAVNDAHVGVGGCSIDSSVRFVRNMAGECGVDFMDRLNFAYLDENGAVKTVHKSKLPEAYSAGLVNDNTLFFDNLVNTKEALENSWKKPLGQSWMKRFV